MTRCAAVVTKACKMWQFWSGILRFAAPQRGWKAACCALWLALLAGFPVAGLLAASAATDAAKGRRIYNEIMQKARVYADPELTAYVDAVGQRMAQASDRRGLDYVFTLIDDPSANAYAIPGGYVFVNRGLLAYLQSEDQLAAVLGHELAHITARHASRQESTGEFTKAASSILGGLTQYYTGSGDLAALPQYLGAAWFSGYGRKMELEADRLGVKFLVRAGYDPAAMLSVIKVLKDQELAALRNRSDQKKPTPKYHGVFSTHPSNDRRLHEVLEEGAALGSGSARRESIGDYLQLIDGLAFGPSKSFGFDRTNTYYNRSLGISVDFPDAWQVSSRGSRLLGHPLDDSRLSYLSVTVAKAPEDVPIETYFTRSMGRNQIADGRHFETATGLPGYRAAVQSHPGGGGFARRSAALVFSRGRAYMVLGEVTRPELFADWLVAFEGTLESLHELSADENFTVATRRIRLHITTSGESYESLATTVGVRNAGAVELLRLLNADYPKGGFGPGERIKLLE